MASLIIRYNLVRLSRYAAGSIFMSAAAENVDRIRSLPFINLKCQYNCDFDFSINCPLWNTGDSGGGGGGIAYRSFIPFNKTRTTFISSVAVQEFCAGVGEIDIYILL